MQRAEGNMYHRTRRPGLSVEPMKKLIGTGGPLWFREWEVMQNFRGDKSLALNEKVENREVGRTRRQKTSRIVCQSNTLPYPMWLECTSYRPRRRKTLTSHMYHTYSTDKNFEHVIDDSICFYHLVLRSEYCNSKCASHMELKL